jgi:hypothetical protein
LIQRQVLEDEQAEFDREVTRHRLCHQDMALKLLHERMQATASLQAARLGMTKRSFFGRVLHGVQWTAVSLFKVVKYVVEV